MSQLRRAPWHSWSESCLTSGVPPANRSLSPTLPRAEFFVRRRYILSPMLDVKKFCGDNSTNVSITAVQNGQRGLAPNRYTVAILFFNCVLPQVAVFEKQNGHCITVGS